MVVEVTRGLRHLNPLCARGLNERTQQEMAERRLNQLRGSTDPRKVKGEDYLLDREASGRPSRP